jgi:hypothetical protein
VLLLAAVFFPRETRSGERIARHHVPSL